MSPFFTGGACGRCGIETPKPEIELCDFCRARMLEQNTHLIDCDMCGTQIRYRQSHLCWGCEDALNGRPRYAGGYVAPGDELILPDRADATEIPS